LKLSIVEAFVSEVTTLLHRIHAGDTDAIQDLGPLVYDELRRMASMRMVEEKAGHTLQPTALVHEAWLRAFENPPPGMFDGKRQFHSAIALMMRRILVEIARKKSAVRHGGDFQRAELRDDMRWSTDVTDELLMVHEALDELAQVDAEAAEIVNLHYFAGIPLPDAADTLQMSRATAYRLWAFARVFLRRKLESSPGKLEQF
jgi:RNA polymerase sigma factor (TIGR02999 family)